MATGLESNRPSKRLWALVLVIITTALMPHANVAGASNEPMISKVIAKEMTAAQDAVKNGQWQESLNNLDAALSKSPLTPFDLKTIYDFSAFAYVKLNKLQDAQLAYERALATGAYASVDAAKTIRLLFRIAVSNQQNAKAIQYGLKVAATDDVTLDDLQIMAQLYYLQKDCKNSVLWSDKAAAFAKKNGNLPKESVYQFKLQCGSDTGDYVAMSSALTDLITLTNKPTYWNTLIRIERQDERNDHNLLMIYRLMYDTNSMSAASDFLEMAQLLSDAALPAEAQAVLEKADTSGVFTDAKYRDRSNALLKVLKPRVEADRKSLPQFEVEANRSRTGDLNVKLGEVYFGFGDYIGAVNAITAGLRKAPLGHADEAYVYLGRSQVALKHSADARKAFTALSGSSNVTPRTNRLWRLYSEQISEQSSDQQLAASARHRETAAAPSVGAAPAPLIVAPPVANAPVVASPAPLHTTDDDVWNPVHRIALVIGNSRYTSPGGTWPDLENGPLADAKGIDALLRGLHFDVTTLTDATLERMNDALSSLANKLSAQPDALVIFYFSGHGTHAPLGPGEDGEDTYLVPVSTDLRREQDAHFKALPLSEVTSVLRATRAGVIILDACRNNALERASTRGAESRGLGRVTAVNGMLIAYSTAAGQVADNRPGQMSRYTEYLIRELGQPGESIEKSFRIVRRRLSSEPGQTHLPELTVELNDDIFLR